MLLVFTANGIRITWLVYFVYSDTIGIILKLNKNDKIETPYI